MSDRTATAARWIAALDRARDEGLAAFVVNGDPRHWFVTAGSAPGAGYTVTIGAGIAPSCGCRAGQSDPVCKHRALVLDRLGMLPHPAPSEPTKDLAALRERGRRASAELFGDAA